MSKRFNFLQKLVVIICIFGITAFPNSTVLADPPLPLPRMPICGDQDGTEQIVFNCSSFSTVVDVQAYEVSGDNPVDLNFDFIFREAQYNNELGFFKVDTPSGKIGSLNPGDSGYFTAAFNQAKTIFPSGSDAFTPDFTLNLNVGDIVVFYIIQDGSLANFLASNPNDELNKGPLAFFSLDQLNPDGVDHFVGFQDVESGITQFGFEDMTGGGDRDYDDIVFNITGAIKPISVIPPFTTSYYIQTKNLETVFGLGCDLGKRDLSLADTQDDIAILMFGSPATEVDKDKNTIYGATVYSVGFASTSDIANLSEQFASGYYNCVGTDTNSHLRVVVGTSNYGPNVTIDNGREWGQMVNTVAAWIVQKDYSSQVDVAGGSDMELAWNTPEITKAWVDGFSATSTHYLYDFGDSQGCPQSGTTSTSGNGKCDHNWTQDDLWYISWGAAPALPFPQDYNTIGAQAKQWQQIALYSSYKQNSTRMTIAGELTQYQACQQRRCVGTDNSPENGWSFLWDALTGDPATTQRLRWSTDIMWGPK